ncbi:MAG: acyl carrier protein [Humidesulfovibrio sp.]|uniref:acyl carrier protein n=1 Tax=Humidesulfovibrio sp. TaxID=2910988 RepID=UPI0027E6AB6B|nr:acyl carrier protein [Humidesulfovibrio sp.]MDQ7836126.1 acyl carrier protein [Humidesulfovibrio sp.]
MDVTGVDLKALLEEVGVKPEVARAVDPSGPLLRQGLDSVDFPSFCALLEERYGLRLDDEAALKLRTLNDFAAAVNGLKG